MTDLSRLLRPESIAVLGAAWAENVIAQCRKMGFAGPVWPVHPTRAQIGGIDCFASLADLPAAPDATFIGVNRHATIDVVSELAAMGAGGAVCFAAGWTEAGAPELQQRLIAAAGAMPILGPNCYGVINYLDGALLWPDQHGGKRVARGVALISQSSNIVINLTMQARALPVAYVACLGNAAQVGLADLAAALLADERVTALGMYVEGIDDAPALAALAEGARAAGKAVICLKSGKTAASRSAAASHTAALAGGGAASGAFLRQAGIAEVATLEQLLEALKIAHVHGPQIGVRICSLSCSGGEAGLVADLAAPHGITFPPPTMAQRARLSATLGPLVTIANPLDYHTFIWGDGPRTTEVFTAMLDGYDAGLFIIDPPRPDRCDPSSFQPALDAIGAAARATGKPAFPVASLPENFDEARAEAMLAEGIAPLMGLDAALGAIRALQGRAGRPGWRPVAAQAPHAAALLDEGSAKTLLDEGSAMTLLDEGSAKTLLDEGSAKALLAAAGVAVPRGVTGRTLAEVAARAAALTPPFALKGLGLAHKTEAGAVRLGLTTLDGQARMVGVQGYLAEEMVPDPVAEVLVGLRRDPVYGITLTLGMGGVMAELLADTVTLILPVAADEVLDALQGLRLWPVLAGYRGRPRADVAALTALVLRLADLMQADAQLQEIELNPVLVAVRGAVAVDALIRKAIP